MSKITIQDGKTYECRITEPCHLDTAELCLRHYLERERQPGRIDGDLRAGQTFFRPEDWVGDDRKGGKS